jgi:hypothetical protein
MTGATMQQAITQGGMTDAPGARPDDTGTTPATMATTAPREMRSPREARLTTILLVGRLVTGDRDWVCRVRNLSSGGLMVECDAALAVGMAVRIELRNLTVLDGEIVWTRPPRAGVRFVAPADVAELLRSGTGQSRRPRAPRLSATCRVLFWYQGRTSAQTLVDLSQSGCRLAIAQPPPVDWPVRITIPGLPPRHATVRWVGDGEAGFAFREILSFRELSAWQADLASRFGERGENRIK